MEELEIYEVYFYNAEDESEHEHWYFKNEENAEKKYKQLCKKYWIRPRYCFSDEYWYTIGYWQVMFSD